MPAHRKKFGNVGRTRRPGEELQASTSRSSRWIWPTSRAIPAESSNSRQPRRRWLHRQASAAKAATPPRNVQVQRSKHRQNMAGLTATTTISGRAPELTRGIRNVPAARRRTHQERKNDRAGRKRSDRPLKQGHAGVMGLSNVYSDANEEVVAKCDSRRTNPHLTAAFNEGDFSARAELSSATGAPESVLEAVNALLEAAGRPVSMLEQSIARMSDEHDRGDIDVTIPADSFKGSFANMARNVNDMVAGTSPSRRSHGLRQGLRRRQFRCTA